MQEIACAVIVAGLIAKLLQQIALSSEMLISGAAQRLLSLGPKVGAIVS
jgi:hypothetical protein